MPRMQVVTSHIWQDKIVRPGKQYEATQQECDLLLQLGWSRQVEEATPTQPARAPRPTAQPKRQYRRRDMTAQK